MLMHAEHEQLTRHDSWWNTGAKWRKKEWNTEERVGSHAAFSAQMRTAVYK